MEKIEIDIDSSVDISEFKKCISFVSPTIIKYSIKKNVLEVFISEEDEKEKISNKLALMMKKYKKVDNNADCYFRNSIEKEKYYNLESNSQDIMFWGNGQISFSERENSF